MDKFYKGKTDPEVWQAFQEGDNEAICWMMQKFYPLLYRYGVKVSGDPDLTKDCIQELFIKLWNNRGQLGQVKAIKPYLLTAFRRRLVDVLAVEQNYARTLVPADREDLFPAVAISFSPEEFLIRAQDDLSTSRQLAQALNKLTNRQREAIYLRYYENLEYTNIAEVMSLKERSVYNLVHEGLNKLRHEFGMAVSLLSDGLAALALLAYLLLAAA